jgi:hypothetical protein
MALALYLGTTVLLLLVWDRWVQRVRIAMAVALIAMPLLFTGRALLTNRTLAPADISFMAEPLHDYARDYGVERPHNLALSDLHCQIIPWQKAVRYALSHRTWPLWNPFILCGDILAGAAQPAVYDPLQFLSLVLPLPDAFTFSVAMTFFLAAFFAWAFGRELGMRDPAALIAAAGFSFCGMMAFFAGWPLGRSWAYLPLVLFGTRRVARGGSGALLTLSFVLTIFAGHPESVLHIVALAAAYGLFELLLDRPGRGEPARSVPRRVIAAILSGIVALLLTAVYLLPFAEAAPQTLEHEIRQQLYARESYDVLAKPDVRAERMKRTLLPGYRGESLDPLSARVGPVVLLLAFAGVLLNARRPETWFFFAVTVVGLLATFGTWPVAHVLHSLPLFNIAINERLAFAAAFAMSLLAALAVDRLPHRAMLAILALVLVQRTVEDGRLYPALSKDAFYPRIPLLATIPHDGRIAGLFFALTPNNSTLYELEDVRGYEAMTNKRLTETYPLWSKYQTAWFNRIDDLSRPFLSFLNVRYALAKADPPEGWIVKAEDRGTRLLENTRVLPRAFIPRRVRYERSGTQVLDAMSKATDFGDLAWIEAAELEPHEVANGPGRLTLLQSGLGYLIDADMESSGWVVVSATAWDGWRAAIDGERVKPRFANHAFLGVYVPKGAHRLLLEYKPRSFVRGRNISLATAIVLAVIAMLARRRATASKAR